MAESHNFYCSYNLDERQVQENMKSKALLDAATSLSSSSAVNMIKASFDIDGVETKIKLPDFMVAAQGVDYGPIDDMIYVDDNVPVPKICNLSTKKQKDFMIIRTLAVALAPGDCRVLSGITKELQGPSSFPYIPGGDCCGIVVEMPPGNSKFKVGDYVSCGFTEKPMGAGGEYAIVNIQNSVCVPSTNILPAHAAAIAGSSPAIVLCQSYIKKGDRVLILGTCYISS